MQSEHVLSLIVAAAKNGVIGRDGKLPWRIPSDLKRFQRLTIGHPVIMGRKNWESIPEESRPLKGRTNIVLTHQAGYLAHGAITVGSIDDARGVAEQVPGAHEIFIIGGANIFRQFLPLAQKAYITKIHALVYGDTYFPEMRPSNWRQEEMPSEPRHPDDQYTTSFHIYERVAV
jgi:dihydrofolate reductase